MEQFAMIPFNLLIDKKLNDISRHIYMVLALMEYQKSINQEIVIGKTEIANRINVSKQEVIRNLKKLESAGYIKQLPSDSRIGKNNLPKFKILIFPTKTNRMSFIKVNRSKILTMPSDILIKFSIIKMLHYNSKASNDLTKYLLVSTELSPYKTKGQIIDDLEVLKEYGLNVNFKYKLEINFSKDELENELLEIFAKKEKAQSEHQAQKKHNNNIQETTEKITLNNEKQIILNKLIEQYEDIERKIKTTNDNLKHGLYDGEIKQLVIDSLPKLVEEKEELKNKIDAMRCENE